MYFPHSPYFPANLMSFKKANDAAKCLTFFILNIKKNHRCFQSEVNMNYYKKQ